MRPSESEAIADPSPGLRSPRAKRCAIINFMSEQLPPAIAAEVRGMYEFRMGVHRVGVVLANGMQIDDVLVSAGRVTRALGHEHVPFEASEVVGVVDQSTRALPPSADLADAD